MVTQEDGGYIQGFLSIHLRSAMQWWAWRVYPELDVERLEAPAK